MPYLNLQNAVQRAGFTATTVTMKAFRCTNNLPSNARVSI